SNALDAAQRAMEGFDTRIARAIRLATRDTQEAKYGSRADSETSQDVTGNLIGAGKRHVSWMVEWDVVHGIVHANWGLEVARRFTPKVSIGKTEHQDRAQMASAVSSLWSGGVITPSQLAYCQTELLGLPPALEGELDALVAQRQGGAGMATA